MWVWWAQGGTRTDGVHFGIVLGIGRGEVVTILRTLGGSVAPLQAVLSGWVGLVFIGWKAVAIERYCLVLVFYGIVAKANAHSNAQCRLCGECQQYYW